MIAGKETVFKTYEDLVDMAVPVFNNVKAIIDAYVDAEVVHIGGTAIPGALTKGDVDLQVRIQPEDYAKAAYGLTEVFEPNNLELWNGDLLIFRDEKNFGVKVDILVTVVGSRDDNCHKIKELLLRDPCLLHEYNEVKTASSGKSHSEYKKRKDAFYSKVKALIS